MYRNVVINIPMFIGIILLIAVVTGLLVWGINTLTILRDEHNDRINAELENIFSMESFKQENTVSNIEEIIETENIE